MNKHNILFMDEHPLLMEGLRSFLSPNPHIRIVGMTNTGQKGIQEITRQKPHICIMEIELPDMHARNIIPILKKIAPECRVCIYTSHTDQRYLFELIHLGMAGFVLKKDPPNILLQAINTLCLGEVFFSGHDPSGAIISLMRTTQKNSPTQSISNLSTREKEIFILLADGNNMKNIAEELHISPKTVESHKYNLFNKLHVTSLSELTKLAIRHGLVQI